MPVAIVTGGSRGLGEALAAGLLERGWSVVTDARDAGALAATADRLVPRYPWMPRARSARRRPG